MRPLLLLTLVGLALLALAAGTHWYGPAAWWTAWREPDSLAATILWQLRLPRLLSALVVGWALGVAGGAYQAIFRNPLADPYVIGAASGGSLGAIVVLLVGLGSGWLTLGAFCGALGAVLLVVLMAGIDGRASAVTLLLAGAAVATVLTALSSLAMLLDDQGLQIAFQWLLGSLAGASWPELRLLIPSVVVGTVGLLLLHRPLDALLLGDEAAQALGLDVARARLGVVLLATLLVAAAVAAAGVVGFVGLVAPHLVRRATGAAHRHLLPWAGVAGAVLVLGADLVARTLAAPRELPLGVWTALAGGPFFLWLLRRWRRLGWA